SHGKPFIEDWPTAVSWDGQYFALTTIEEEFRVVDLSGDFSIHAVGTHTGWIGGVTVLKQSRLLVTAGGNDQTIAAWDLLSGKLIWKWEGQGRITALSSSPSERLLIVGTEANEMRVVDISTAGTIATFTFDALVTVIDVHACLPLIAVGDKTGRVHALILKNCTLW
ncbi:MAG TPA: WD40 repeat domain-containing protein, partial [Puia sp.]|nr:WD40 repeat domain-containing protein [Puia sp.]